MNIGQTLRTAMLDSKLTRYAIAQASGINQSVLSRFAHDQRGLSMENAERLAEVLGFQLACIKTHKQADYRTKGDAT